MKQLWCTIREPLCINIHRLFPWLRYCHIDAGKVNPHLNSTQGEVFSSYFCFILAENSFVMVAHLLNSTVSASHEWEFCVGSAEDNSPMSDTLGHVHTLNTTLVLFHIPFSCCNPRDAECGYRFLQHIWEAVKGKYSCGSLDKYSKKDLWLVFRWHCVITIPSVKEIRSIFVPCFVMMERLWNTIHMDSTPSYWLLILHCSIANHNLIACTTLSVNSGIYTSVSISFML